MAKINVSWVESQTYEATVEIADPENMTPSDLRAAIAEQIDPDDLSGFEQPDEERDIEILGHDVQDGEL